MLPYASEHNPSSRIALQPSVHACICTRSQRQLKRTNQGKRQRNGIHALKLIVALKRCLDSRGWGTRVQSRMDVPRSLDVIIEPTGPMSQRLHLRHPVRCRIDGCSSPLRWPNRCEFAIQLIIGQYQEIDCKGFSPLSIYSQNFACFAVTKSVR